MGLSDALRNRLALARGESLGATVRIFLASREERKKIAARKFPGGSMPKGALRPDARRQAAGETVATLVDPQWYAGTHGVAEPEAVGHFARDGLAAGLAPRAVMAGSDGRHLAPRAAELLHRMGLPLGATPTGAEGPVHGLDPWTIADAGRRRLAVVTALSAPSGRLPYVPPEWWDLADFYAVTGFPIAGPGPWQTVRPVFHHPDPRRVAGFAKTHLPAFFGSYPRVLWLDPDVMCCADPARIADMTAAGLTCFRLEDRAPGAEAAAAAPEAPNAVAEFLADVASHPAFGQLGCLDAAVLLIDPSDAAVRRLMTRFWRHIARGAGSERLALTLAAAETSDLVPAELPGRALARSPDFALAGSA